MASKKFTATEAVIRGWGKLKAEQDALIKVLPLPILILVVMEFFRLQTESPSIMFLSAILSIYLYAVIAISVHRIILIGGDAVDTPVMLPKQRTFEFIVYSIAIGVILIPLVVLLFLPPVGIVLFYLAAAYLVGRVSLVLPSLAIDNRWTFAESWRATRNYQFEMFFIVGILPFISVIPELLLRGIPGAGPLLVLLSSMVSIFVITTLSVAFSLIQNEK